MKQEKRIAKLEQIRAEATNLEVKTNAHQELMEVRHQLAIKLKWYKDSDWNYWDEKGRLHSWGIRFSK